MESLAQKAARRARGNILDSVKEIGSGLCHLPSQIEDRIHTTQQPKMEFFLVGLTFPSSDVNMSLNIGNLITAFEAEGGKSSDLVWNRFQRFLDSVSEKQGAGISQILLRSSAVAKCTAPSHLKKSTKVAPGLIHAMGRGIKSTRTDDLAGPFLLQYAIEVLLVSTDAVRVAPRDFTGLFKSITVGEFESILGPAIVRAIRRSPTRSMTNVTGILECCSVDMSSTSGEIVSALLDCISNSDMLEPVSKSIAAIFRQSAQDDARVEIVSQLSKAFTRFGQQSVDVAAAAVLSQVCRASKTHIKSRTVGKAFIESPMLTGLQKQLRAAPTDDTRSRIATSIGDLAGLLISSEDADSTTDALKLLKEDLVALLLDKKVSDTMKSAILIAIESICGSASDADGAIDSKVVPLDALLPFLPLLGQGRMTARTACLSAWSIALRCAIADSTVDKRLIAAFQSAVSADASFAPLIGEDSPANRALLASIARSALTLSASLSLASSGESETIVLGSPPTERMKNRFCVNLLKIIAVTSASSFIIPADLSPAVCNRLSLAMYELVTMDGSSLPGHLARVALVSLFPVIGRMDPDWAALVLVLSQHAYFASRRYSTDHLWHKLRSKNPSLSKDVKKNLDAITGLILQGSQLPVSDRTGFRSACLGTVNRLADLAVSTESILALAKSALARVSAENIAACEDELPIYFCPEHVVWRSDTEDWVPSETTTLAPTVVVPGKPGAVQTKSSGVTREDMMRQALKEQAVTRRRIGEIANRTSFSIDLVARVIATARDDSLALEVCGLTTARMADVMVLLKSPLTSVSTLRLVVSVSQLLGHQSPEEIATALSSVSSRLVSTIEEEQWIALFNTLSGYGCDTVSRADLVWPLFESALATDFRPQIALSAISALTDLVASINAPFDVSKILHAVKVSASASPGPFAGPIGKLLRLLAPTIETHDVHALSLFSLIAVTDEPKLFIEVATSIHKLPAAVVQTDVSIGALVLLGSFEEATHATKDLVPMVNIGNDAIVGKLVDLLSTEPLIQRLSSESLSFVAAQRVPSNIAHILALCESAFMDPASTPSSLLGIATALKTISKSTSAGSAEYLSHLIEFIITRAMERPDLTVAVRDELLACLQDGLSTNGETHALALSSLTESFIGKTKSEAAGLSVPVVLGILTKFLPASDERVQSVRTKLVAQLLTAEPAVQTKIAAVMPPLLKMSEDVPKYLETFLNTALSTTDSKARYGAALGVGAAARAQGVAVLRQMDVLKTLQQAAEDSKNADRRQGAIAVYGGLSLALGRLFEPYVAQILPVLLIAFGDGNFAVREASNLAASQIMANLSTHGIKLVLPSLLAGVQDLQWRTKLGSIKLLSAMLRCAPKQLSTCLPRVVPAISDVATDTHSKVREAACASLTDIEAIIINPEIRACSHKLIASLTDPANDHLRQEALDVLLSTSFVHSLDAASLALVVPVMLRATRERRSEIKRKGAQILGSVAVLAADPQEGLGPYMDMIVPALQDVLVDPIPDVRATAAKALGTMSRALPEVIVAQVLPWLFRTLKEADSQVERSGAAHGLSEVLVELGPEHFAAILPEVVGNAVNPNTNPEAREGYLGLFIFLPSVMKNAFVPHIEVVFPVLIQGLSDALTPVREVAFRAASAICAQFGASHATLLMPSLERGLFARDWRARHASVHLVGQTLEALMKSARGGNRDNLLESQVPLTQEKRSYMLAMLYIVRSDGNQSVNQNSQSVWKNVVSNTPRTLRMILPILVRLLIANLSSSDEESAETRQVLAGRCLGDLVGKLGDRVLPDLMPILVDNINSPDPTVRAGVCVGLADIVAAANRQLLQEYFSITFPAVRVALCDESSVVRTKAGSLTSLLYTTLGNTTINSTLPQILENAQSSDSVVSAGGVRGLEQLILALPKELLLMVIDALVTEPVTAEKIRAIEAASVAPATELAKHVSRIVSFLMVSHNQFPGEVLHAGNELFARLNRHASHLALIELIRGLGDNNNGQLREACASLIASCVKCAPLEVVAEYMDTLVPVLIRGLLADSYQPAMEACLLAFGEIVTKFTKENMVKYMRLIADTVDNVVAEKTECPGLALPRTFETVWPVYQQALMFGSTDGREAAAAGLVVLLKQTPNERLKPNAIKVTGPLIRVLGDRYPAPVRVSLLLSLQVLLERLESALKPFLPQLQTTYQKCAQDTDDEVKRIAQDSQVLLSKLGGKPSVS